MIDQLPEYIERRSNDVRRDMVEAKLRELIEVINKMNEHINALILINENWDKSMDEMKKKLIPI